MELHIILVGDNYEMIVLDIIQKLVFEKGRKNSNRQLNK